ncbi:MAG: pyridoxal phosphate-dependent aminotransferase [Deltaproteobacteria bacterium]|nr:pyridoxal phosphate-dependent aminotransferase [Deltaproteobacteria bacterium]
MRFAERTNWPREENALTLAIRRQRSLGPVLDLTVSNPTEVGLGFPGEALQVALHSALLHPYQPEPFGLPSARAAVSAYYRARGLVVPPERIAIVASTSEAYLALFRLLAEPGDEVLYPVPSYPLLEFLTDLSDLKLRPYPLGLVRDRWAMDPDELAAALSPQTRAMVQVGPNNPTGSCFDPAERAAFYGIAAERGLAVISDEVFLDYHPGTFLQHSFAQDHEALSFTLSGLSKVAALPHLKLSWLVVNGPEVLVAEAMARLELILDASLSVATPVQAALPELLPAAEKVQAGLRARIAQNWGQVAPLHPLPREGGWYTLVPVPEGLDEEVLAIRLVEEQQVLTHPGFFFDLAGGSTLVLSLIAEPAVFQTGVQRLAHLLGG